MLFFSSVWKKNPNKIGVEIEKKDVKKENRICVEKKPKTQNGPKAKTNKKGKNREEKIIERKKKSEGKG